METSNCILCSSDCLKTFPAFENLNQLTSDCKETNWRSQLLSCQNCGHVQKKIDEKYLSALSKIYSDYYAYELADGEEQFVYDDLTKSFVPRSKLIVDEVVRKYFISNTRVLDIGCGNGGTLRQLSRYVDSFKLSLYGHEIDNSRESQFKLIKGFSELFSCDLSSIDLKFDFVLLIHSLEHFTEPVRMLSIINDMLSEDGLLLVQLPNFERNPFDILIFDHVSHFYPHTINLIMSKCGFELIEIKKNLISKEITLVAKKLKNRVAQECIHELLPDVSIEKNLLFLHDEIVKIKDYLNSVHPGSFGIFGTSIASTWITTYLIDYIDFFVDEDLNRVGKTFMSRPVLHPDQVSADSVVYFFLAPELSIKVASKFSNKKWQKILVG